MARRPVLNAVKKAEILAVLATGCPRQTAADYVGCDLKTIYNTALRDDEFYRQLRRRERHAEVAHLVNLNNAGKESRYWRASAWFLERIRPESYGTRTPETLTREELSALLSRFTEMMVEEVPVARFRKQIIARFDKFFSNTPERLEKNFQRRKNFAEKKLLSAENSPSDDFEIPENRQKRLGKP
jgi:hypothetical protein